MPWSAARSRNSFRVSDASAGKQTETLLSLSHLPPPCHCPRRSLRPILRLVGPGMRSQTLDLLRPHTLAGGKWHRPFFESMVQWATVDHPYGEQARLAKEGFTAAQGVINILEVTLYMMDFGIVQSNGTGIKGRSFGGRSAALAVLVGFGVGVVTATKTSLYCTFSARMVSMRPATLTCKSYERGVFGLQVHWSE